MIKTLQEERDQLAKSHKFMEEENKQCLKIRSEAEAKFLVVKEENDKLKQTYEILKEHEMNLIRDLEEKKNKEIVFYEGKIQGVNSEMKDVQYKLMEKDQASFQQREEIKKLEYQITKLKDDCEYHSQLVNRL